LTLIAFACVAEEAITACELAALEEEDEAFFCEDDVELTAAVFALPTAGKTRVGRPLLTAAAIDDWSMCA
jgi:hypothetical protein